MSLLKQLLSKNSFEKHSIVEHNSIKEKLIHELTRLQSKVPISQFECFNKDLKSQSIKYIEESIHQVQDFIKQNGINESMSNNLLRNIKRKN